MSKIRRFEIDYNTLNLIATSVSSVVIISLMATYTQIMIHLDEKYYSLAKPMENKQDKLKDARSKIRHLLNLLTYQTLLFFAVLFILLPITGVLIFKTVDSLLVQLLGIFIIILLFFSQIIHIRVFWISNYKFICKDKWTKVWNRRKEKDQGHA